jgi:hypothetical protein
MIRKDILRASPEKIFFKASREEFRYVKESRRNLDIKMEYVL